MSDEEIGSDAVSSYCLLIDRQHDLASKSTYSRYAYKILNHQGVQEMADLTLGYDPAYEALILHSAYVHRGAQVIDKLDSDPIRTFQRESNLERRMYDGSLTVLMNLSDVRIGDIIEYSFTRRGQHPAYGEHDFGVLLWDFLGPVEKLRMRVLVPTGRDIAFKPLHTNAQPTVTKEAGHTAYEWTRDKGKAFEFEPNVPIWYNSFGRIKYTDYKSWSDLVQWALPLFDVSDAEREKLRSLARDLVAPADTPARVVHAIRFVQNEIRYLALEEGMSAYRPHPPSQVWTQRYGDCKDKSLLLVALLNELGIDAHPMLVNTAGLRTSEDFVVAPGDFDHCVITFDYDGRQYYVDPTVAHQGGDLEHTYFPDYQLGLIIAPGSDHLAVLPEPDVGEVRVTEHFRLDDRGRGASLTVSTEYRGYQADLQRAQFAAADIATIKDSYLNYYAAQYPQIDDGNVSYRDSLRDSENVFVVTENYRIRDIWKAAAEDTSTRYIEFLSQDLNVLTDWETTSNRRMPYAVGRIERRHELIVEGPGDWYLEAADAAVAGNLFEYKKTVSREHARVSVVQEYRRTASYIDAPYVADFVAKQDQIRASLSSFAITSSAAIGSVSWVMIVFAVACLLGSLWAARRIYREYDPEPRLDHWHEGDGPSGIRGWLLVPLVGLVVESLRVVATVSELAPYFDADVMAYVSDTYRMLMCFELLTNVAAAVMMGLLIVLFINRRTSTPHLIMIYMVSMLILMVVDYLLVKVLMPAEFAADASSDAKYITRQAVACAIWIPYFLRSERVKRTFVVRRTGPAAQPVPVGPDWPIP